MVVSIERLEKSYALGTSKVEVLKGLDLSVEAGRIVAVMGPSGSGKSTLLNCVAGLDIPDRGSVRVLGEDLARLDDEARTLARRRKMGIIYQFFNLVPNLDVAENVMLPYLIEGESPPMDEVMRTLDRVGMSHRKKHLPGELSGGEMQLVSIARAILRRPRLILADEPTGNVNVATGRRIMKVLQEVLREAGAAMILVTHNPEDASCADRVVFIEDGAIQAGHALEGNDVTTASIHARLQELGI